MRINNIIRTNYNTSFTSKNKTTRNTDDLQRKVIHEFPMASLSSHYCTNSVVTKNLPHPCDNYTKKRLYEHLLCKIASERKKYDINDLSAEGLSKLAQTVKKCKCGNCIESADIMLGALYANGYYNSITASPVAKITAENKNYKNYDGTLGRNEEKTEKIDHKLVISDLNTDTEYVLDPWLNVVLPLAEYKAKLKESILSPQISKAEKRAEDTFSDIYSLFLKEEDTHVTGPFLAFNRDEMPSEDEKIKIGEKFRQDFPEIISENND